MLSKAHLSLHQHVTFLLFLFRVIFSTFNNLQTWCFPCSMFFTSFPCLECFLFSFHFCFVVQHFGASWELIGVFISLRHIGIFWRLVLLRACVHQVRGCLQKFVYIVYNLVIICKMDYQEQSLLLGNVCCW